jgi:chromate reductase
MQQPEAYVGGAAELFNDQGDLQEESTREFLRTFIQSFADWVVRVSEGKAQTSAAA